MNGSPVVSLPSSIYEKDNKPVYVYEDVIVIYLVSFLPSGYGEMSHWD
jgi:hypothetical protein